MSLTLSMDFQFTTTVEKLWTALTDSKKLARWITENDFQPVVGYRFQFHSQPVEGVWDGIIAGEVLAVEAPTRLSYTWGVTGETHTVTWTLEDLGNGTINLHLEQTGISQPYGLAGAKHGWTAWCEQLETLLAQ